MGFNRPRVQFLVDGDILPDTRKRHSGDRMSVPRFIDVLTFCLIAGLLAAASPALAERAGNYNDAQLKLLFSGSKVVATGKGTCKTWPGEGEVFLNFAFAANGTFSVDYLCTGGSDVLSTLAPGAYVDVNPEPVKGKDNGTWEVKDNRFCIDFSGAVAADYLPDRNNCWPVKYEKSQLGLYAEGQAFWTLNVSHLKFPTKEKLLAALGELAGKTAAKADLTLPPAEYKPLPVGTIINYDKRTYTVQKSSEFEIVVKESKSGNWNKLYAVFGRQGYDSYTLRVTYVWRD